MTFVTSANIRVWTALRAQPDIFISSSISRSVAKKPSDPFIGLRFGNPADLEVFILSLAYPLINKWVMDESLVNTQFRTEVECFLSFERFCDKHLPAYGIDFDNIYLIPVLELRPDPCMLYMDIFGNPLPVVFPAGADISNPGAQVNPHVFPTEAESLIPLVPADISNPRPKRKQPRQKRGTIDPPHSLIRG